MNKIPEQLHPLRLKIENNLDFTPKRLKKEAKETMNTIDPNTIDNQLLERVVRIFSSYKRYKDKQAKKESRLLKTPIKRNKRTMLQSEIYYTILKPRWETNQTWYTKSIRIKTNEMKETKTYYISPSLPKETANLLIIIEISKQILRNGKRKIFSRKQTERYSKP